MGFIVLLVLFVVAMALWGFGTLNNQPNTFYTSSWIPFICVLILGIVVFLSRDWGAHF
jgi:hypothetical protein